MRRNRGLPAIGLRILFVSFSTVMNSLTLYCWSVRVVVSLVPGDVECGVAELACRGVKSPDGNAAVIRSWREPEK